MHSHHFGILLMGGTDRLCNLSGSLCVRCGGIIAKDASQRIARRHDAKCIRMSTKNALKVSSMQITDDGENKFATKKMHTALAYKYLARTRS